MSNKDHLWRLEDDNGKPVAEKPKDKAKAFFNGKLIGELQPLTIERVESFRARPVEIFRQEYMASWGDPDDNRPVGVRRETIEQEHRDIFDLIMREHHRYEARFGQRPEYISLSVAAYRSFWVEVRGRGHYAGSRTLSEERFMGLEIMCHPYQEQPVLALGRGREEGIEGRLYREHQ